MFSNSDTIRKPVIATWSTQTFLFFFKWVSAFVEAVNTVSAVTFLALSPPYDPCRLQAGSRFIMVDGDGLIEWGSGMKVLFSRMGLHLREDEKMR